RLTRANVRASWSERTTPVAKVLQFSGPMRYRWRAVWMLFRTSIFTLARRLVKGPLRPGWNLTLEISTAYLRESERWVFHLPSIERQRLATDALVFTSPALGRVTIGDAYIETVSGRWYIPPTTIGDVTMFYLHGGGYAFSSGAHINMIATIAQTAGVKVFALDYPLTPEHP